MEAYTMTTNKKVLQFVDEAVALAKPDKVVWIDGSEAQLEALRKEAIASGEMIKLNDEKLPGCLYHRTKPNDVARVEGRTFICSRRKEDAGPTNNWMDPEEMYKKLKAIAKDSMIGRTMYVIPFSMGAVNSPFAKIGIETTDSIYVVLNMAIMTRIGQKVLDRLGDSEDVVRGFHAKCNVDENERYIVQFPEDNAIWSVNSAYGGNVLLGKKCFALRIASYQGKNEGWMAEHMLILGVEKPNGETKYVTAAFPSACGKTNLAMLIPPEIYTKKGYRVYTVGDDIAWLRVGADGRLYAINPEAGFFGVAPGTNEKSNPNALASTRKNTIFTNVAINPEDNTVWWEGLTKTPPARLIDWKGNPWTPDMKDADGKPVKAAHPNSRFTAPAINCPCISSEFEAPNGVPISAIIFGGRRAATTPLAMLPFCGYHMGDYFQHWIDMGKKIKVQPKIFNVNWFRTDSEGHFIWPGFGDNMRVLDWILKRCEETVDADETAIGYVPKPEDINLEGCSVDKETLKGLLNVDTETWKKEAEGIKEFYKKFGDRLPKELEDELAALESRLN